MAATLPPRSPREPSFARSDPPLAARASITETYDFRFSASRTFRDKLQRLAEVPGVHDPVRSIGEILEKAVDCLPECKDPQRRHARRERADPQVRLTVVRSYLAPPPRSSASCRARNSLLARNAGMPRSAASA